MEKKRSYETDEQGNIIVYHDTGKLWDLFAFFGFALLFVGYGIVEQTINYIAGGIVFFILFAISLSIFFYPLIRIYFYGSCIYDTKHGLPAIVIRQDGIDVLNSPHRCYDNIAFKRIDEFCKDKESVGRGTYQDVVYIMMREFTSGNKPTYKTKVGDYHGLPCYVVEPRESYKIIAAHTISPDELLKLLNEKMNEWRESHSALLFK